ncbi:metal-dependent hydrolase [Pelosinus sp. UFO1]|uniref:metal-dependent hydrolase n=1 Tax=Pelosinus sp. UFO1 TaxID=484770 RepID=UPI001F1E0814|nr:metal-dependent hydrolase [Pelosinus sp. UFO1]
MLFIMIGSLLPDIDHRRSMVGRLNIFVKFMSHRGFCHTLVGCIVLSLPFLLIQGAAPYVFLGGVSHLFGDRLQSAYSSKMFRIKGW